MRITIKTLRAQVDALNKMLGKPTQVWTTDGNGVNHSWVGAYVLDAAYGRYRLCQIVTDGGGERDITGLLPAGQCADAIRAYVQGLNDAKAS